MSLSAIRSAAADFTHSKTRRRLAYAGALFVALVLCVFPRPYVARVKILPQDDTSGVSALITALGGGAQNFASVLGGRTNYLVIGRSHDVQRDVVQRLRENGRTEFADQNRAEVILSRKVDIQVLSGGILQITSKDHDPGFAKDVVSAYTDSITERLAVLGHEQVAQKKIIVTKRLDEAVESLSNAEAAMNEFRYANGMASPVAEFGAILNRKLGYEAQLQAKQVELETAKAFAANENIRIRAILNEISVLREQISELEGAARQNSPLALSVKNVEYERLYRDLMFSQSMVVVYRRFFEEVNVEEMSADINVQIIEQPFVDPRRQFNIYAVGAVIVIIVLSVFTEYYVPLTGLGGFGTRRRRGNAASASNQS